MFGATGWSSSTTEEDASDTILGTAAPQWLPGFVCCFFIGTSHYKYDQVIEIVTLLITFQTG